MVDVSANVNAADLRALSDVIRRMQEDTDRSTFNAVTYAAVKVAESGRSDSKPGKKRRPIAKADHNYKAAVKTLKWARGQQRKGLGIPSYAHAMLGNINAMFPYYIESFRQGAQGMVKIGRYEKDANDPARNIKNWGLAKKTWNVMAAKAAAAGNGRGNYHRREKRWTVSATDSADGSMARLVNRLSYLEKAYPGTVSRAIQKGTKALEWQLKKDIAELSRRANGGRR